MQISIIPNLNYMSMTILGLKDDNFKTITININLSKLYDL